MPRIILFTMISDKLLKGQYRVKKNTNKVFLNDSQTMILVYLIFLFILIIPKGHVIVLVKLSIVYAHPVRCTDIRSTFTHTNARNQL